MVELPGAADHTCLKFFLSSFLFDTLEPSQSLFRGHEEMARAARLPDDGVSFVYTSDS